MVAAFEVVAEIAVGTIRGILEIGGVVRLGDVDGMQDQFAIDDLLVVHAFLVVQHPNRIEEFFTTRDEKTKIAVFRFPDVIAVIAVRGVEYYQRFAGNPGPELIELFEEGSGIVVRKAELHSLPFVAPPAIVAIDHVRSGGMVKGDGFLAAFSAGAPVKRPLVPESHHPPYSALGAKIRRVHLHLVIERGIVIGNGVRTSAIQAFFRFGAHTISEL
jgi:hypothetical protein